MLSRYQRMIALSSGLFHWVYHPNLKGHFTSMHARVPEPPPKQLNEYIIVSKGTSAVWFTTNMTCGQLELWYNATSFRKITPIFMMIQQLRQKMSSFLTQKNPFYVTHLATWKPCSSSKVFLTDLIHQVKVSCVGAAQKTILGTWWKFRGRGTSVQFYFSAQLVWFECVILIWWNIELWNFWRISCVKVSKVDIWAYPRTYWLWIITLHIIQSFPFFPQPPIWQPSQSCQSGWLLKWGKKPFPFYTYNDPHLKQKYPFDIWASRFLFVSYLVHQKAHQYQRST